MKYLDEYRDDTIAMALVERITRTATRPWTIMEVCGGQTHTLIRQGIDQVLDGVVELVHGPGCPVCVTPLALIDEAIAIAKQPERDPLLVRRHAARARLGRRPLHGAGGRRRRPRRLLASRRPGGGPPQPREDRRVLRGGLRDHRARPTRWP